MTEGGVRHAPSAPWIDRRAFEGPPPEPLLAAARRMGDDVQVAVEIRDPDSTLHVIFIPPCDHDGPAPILRVPRDRSLLARAAGHEGPLVIQDLVRGALEEERDLLKRGIRAFVAIPVELPAFSPALVVFASRIVRRFDAATIGALLGDVDEWSRTNGHDASTDSAAEALDPEARPDQTVIGESPEFLEICRLIGIVSRQDTTVLIQGESGTGKELLAHTIHRYSRRASGPFIRVNCAALTETLLESEMFGHRKGAFTGAIYTNKGRFELADGGTLLLDEIGNMSLTGQAKLLRVLQEREFEPVGQSSSVRVNVRIIATTNVRLEQAITQGQFRQDLYYRLATVPIWVPPLRSRRRDIVPLAEHFLARSFQVAGKTPRPLADGARQMLLHYDWPGNAREIKNSMDFAVLVARGAEIAANDLPAAVTTGLEGRSGLGASLREQVMQFEKGVLLEAIERSAGVRKDAAQRLGIDPRNFRYFLRKHGIE